MDLHHIWTQYPLAQDLSAGIYFFDPYPPWATLTLDLEF